MRILYSLLHNADAMFMRPGKVNDRYVRGHVGELHVKDDSAPEQMLESVFALHNWDDRPDAKRRPSLSVGDVVVLGYDEIWTVDMTGWKKLEALPGSLLDEYPDRG